MSQRVAAATATAQNNLNCQAIGSFYWEIGDRSARLASGTVVGPMGTIYTASTKMAVASASKWLYGAYVAQRRGGAPSADDVNYLSFHSGYTAFSTCLADQTVQQCEDYRDNGLHVDATDGLFDYDSGHMQRHAAAVMGLGGLDTAGLAAEMRAKLGSDINMSYAQVQLAGGVETTADDYARFLRKLLNGSLQMSNWLGRDKACASAAFCPTQALPGPAPADEFWEYSLGHWVESDPHVGDGSYSSAGSFGFYPWVDATRTWYGIVARDNGVNTGFDSVQCGRQVRKAWVSGIEQ